MLLGHLPIPYFKVREKFLCFIVMDRVSKGRQRAQVSFLNVGPLLLIAPSRSSWNRYIFVGLVLFS